MAGQQHDLRKPFDEINRDASQAQHHNYRAPATEKPKRHAGMKQSVNEWECHIECHGDPEMNPNLLRAECCNPIYDLLAYEYIVDDLKVPQTHDDNEARRQDHVTDTTQPKKPRVFNPNAKPME